MRTTIGVCGCLILLLGVSVVSADEKPKPEPRPGNKAERPTTAKAMVDRPVLEINVGKFFRWAAPRGWKFNETTNGVDMAAADGKSAASATILLRSPGRVTPKQFILAVLPTVGCRQIKVEATKELEDQPSGIPGAPWKVTELQLSYKLKDETMHGTWTCGISQIFNSYNAFVVGYQAIDERWDAARLWLPEVARSVVITNPAQVAGNDKLIPVRNNPLDNSALLESWRQKGLSEDRIAKARHEATSGYERVKDPDTGQIYEMPLEAYDGTVGGYRNPKRPGEILEKTKPGE